MSDTIDLATLEQADLEALARDIQAEIARRAPEYRQIVCRQQDLSCSGSGPRETRRVRLPDGRAGWASDLAQNLRGHWSTGRTAADRHSKEEGEFPVGTVVLSYTNKLEKRSKNGGASVRCGVIVSLAEDPTEAIRWGLSTRGRGAEVEVQLPGGEWTRV
jgi:hypothetical protein